MIFEQEVIPFQILDVFYLDQGNKTSTFNSNRNFDALSFRIESDAVVKSGNNCFEFMTNSIGYFPSDVTYSRSANIDKVIVVHFKSFRYRSGTVEKFVPEDSDKYSRLFHKILECWNSKKISYKHEASAILCEIFATMYEDNRPALNADSKISEALKYINENMFKKDLSLQTAAAKSMISDVYFRKLFKEEFGISPKKYIINARIKQAQSLIITKYFTIGEIADMCGYEDSKHFSVEFKKHTGISPSEYTYNY